MKLRQGCHKRTPRWCWTVLVLVGIVVLPGGAFVVGGEDPVAPSRVKNADDSAKAGPQDLLGKEAKPGATRSLDGTEGVAKTTSIVGEGVASDAGIYGRIQLGDSTAKSKSDNRRIQIFGPVLTGKAVAQDPPTKAQILAALQKRQGGKAPRPEPGEVRLVLDKIADYVDPPRFVPLLGPAQLHHVHYKCTPYRISQDRGDAEANAAMERAAKRPLYIDHCHYWLVEREAAADRRGESEPLYTVAYQVADLANAELEALIPLDRRGVSKATSQSDRHLDWLLTDLRQSVAPRSWKSAGGSAVAEPYRENATLVVRQTKANHAEVVRYLNGLRDALDKRPVPPPASSSAAPAIKVRPICKVYRVAELVVPVRCWYSSLHRAKAPAEKPDFDALIHVLTTTVAPDSWEKAGGQGHIEVSPHNLSLVVAQSAEVHEQVADLLEQLQCLRQLQVAVESRIIEKSTSSLRSRRVELERTSDPAGGDAVNRPFAILTRKQTLSLLGTNKLSGDSFMALPKVTAFTGQTISLGIHNLATSAGAADPTTTVMRMRPVCSGDHKSVQLGFDFGTNESEPLRGNFRIPLGASLVVDLTNDLRFDHSHLPTATNRLGLKKNASRLVSLAPGEKPRAGRTVLLVVTPTIIDRVKKSTAILDGVTPRGVFITEEEERLGLEN